MNEITSTFLQSELAYRSDRIKSGTAGSRRRAHRLTRVRRGAGTAADTTR
jgi:hypothetical protein